MGRDKAFIEIAGRPLIEIQLEKLRSLTDNVFVSANDSGAYRYLGVPVIPDSCEGQGPLAGISAALRHARGALLIVLACDLPAVREQQLLRLVAACAGYDVAVPETADGRLHPLTAVYRTKSCLPVFDSCLATGRNGIASCLAAETLRVARICPEAGGFQEADLVNLNTISELQGYLQVVGRQIVDFPF
jgi:molybdenum cofactor guanylyltransferase